MENFTIQPEGHGDAQAHLTFDNTSPYVPQPESSINSHSNYDTGRVRVQGVNNLVNAYQVGVMTISCRGLPRNLKSNADFSE